MTIVQYKRKFRTVERIYYRDYIAICCDGCGHITELRTTEFDRALTAIDAQGWHTIPFDYGFRLDIDDPISSIGYEHFCCDDCLDDEDLF